MILLDHKSKTAWHLPSLSVLLYMVQTYCAYRGFEVYCSTIDTSNRLAIPVAQRSLDGGEAALQIINASLTLTLRRDGKETTFGAAVEAICLSLEIGHQFASDAWDAAIKHKRAAPRCIVGFETMDLLKEKST